MKTGSVIHFAAAQTGRPKFLLAPFLLPLLGCHGPLFTPTVERLCPQQQAQVDSAWSNMLTPADRLHRELLLDTLIANQMHQRGIDRLEFVSEKEVNGGRVTIRISFDRGRPKLDAYIFTFTNQEGVERRHECFTADEINKRCAYLGGYDPDGGLPLFVNDEGKCLSAEEEKRREDMRAALLARQREIIAATQPAGAEVVYPVEEE